MLKNYLTKLSDFDIVPCGNTSTENVILFKINKMVYEKDEYATDKFISIVSAMTYTDSSIYLIVDGHKSHTDFYLGIKSEDENRQKSSVAETFKNSILGQFPGAEIEDYSYIKVDSEHSKQDKLLHRISEAVSVSSCVGIPSYKNSKGEYVRDGVADRALSAFNRIGLCKYLDFGVIPEYNEHEKRLAIIKELRTKLDELEGMV